MKQRFRSGGKPIKGRRRKTPAKRRNVPNDTPSPNVPNSKNDLEFRRLTRELSEAREQQAATSEVLKAISGSTFDLRTVLDKLLQSAVRLCGADQGTVAQRKGGTFYRSVSYGFSPVYLDYVKDIPVKPGRDTGTGRALLEGKVIHIPDVLADPDFTWKEGQRLGGFRTVLGVPMLREGVAVGVLALTRSAVRPFSGEQIALVENFAAQAVIAIDNARLLDELRRRTEDLTEALEQQKATSDLLQVISGSPGNLEPVFHAMLENAVGICGANFGNMFLYEDGAFRTVAMYNAPEAYANARRGAPFHPPSDSGLGRLAAAREVVQIADLRTEESYINRDPFVVAGVELGGIRTLLAVPMLKEEHLVGGIVIYRQEVRPFSEKQIELVRNFASQVVIAIENARLLNELSQSLEQQTATSEVLQVISSSPGDLQPVFESLLRNATQLCKAKFGTLYLREEGGVRLVAAYDMPAKFNEVQSRAATEPAPGGPLEGALKTKRAVQIPDLAATELYRQRHPRTVDAVELGRIRTAVAVPMLKDDEPIGVISIHRPEVALFDEKQIALLTSFAAQAVIAIENARLLTELRESLQEQTATSEVLQVISSSPGDLEPVFAAMLEKAVSICDAKFGNIYRWDGEALHVIATHNTPQAFVEGLRRAPYRPNPKAPIGQMVATKTVVHVTDVMADTAYIEQTDPMALVAVALGHTRTALAVPLLNEGEVIGAFVLSRQEVRPFTEKQIALITNFAAQAVIAIENARLLKELRERTSDLERSYGFVQQQASQLEAQSQELVTLNHQLEQRVADQVGEIERMGSLRRFLPPQVADLIVASGTEKQLESHRREITALFCDLRGFTGFSEASAPEDVMTLLRDYHAAIGEIIIKYSGTLERYAGDGVMVVFNDPVPVDNPALRAVQMALETREAMGALTEKWRELGHDVGFGIGIAHGYATLGTIGFEGRFDYAAIGTVSNVASRLCDEAKPGQILISPRVFMAVKDVVTVEPVGEFTLKGIGRPLAAYNVLAAAPPNA